jgi:hypothetical protein
MKWYRKAADAGDTVAAQRLRELDKPDAAQRLREGGGYWVLGRSYSSCIPWACAVRL